MKRINIILIITFLIIISGLIISPFLTGYFINISTNQDIIKKEYKEITIPVKVHLIKESRGVYSTGRNRQNVNFLFEEVNRIWEPASINYEITDIVITETNFSSIPNALTGNYLSLVQNNNYNNNMTNIFFVQSLNGINGLALVGADSILVADFTTVNDYRTTAHELGHLHLLEHVKSPNGLMAQGKNGEYLSKSEIEVARKNALI
jgi:hypothetical protein